MFKRILIALLIVINLFSCTKDDICTEGTPTTPLLVVVFRDVTDPVVKKAAQDLSVITLDGNETAVIFEETTDSIRIPLRTNIDSTQYQFVLNSSDSINFNVDRVILNYSREDIYVNRACAYKTIYKDLGAVLAEGEDLHHFSNRPLHCHTPGIQVS